MSKQSAQFASTARKQRSWITRDNAELEQLLKNDFDPKAKTASLG